MNFEPLPPEIAARAESFRSHPHFPEAVRRQIRRYLVYFESNAWMNKLTYNEVNQYLCSYMIYLHYWRDESNPFSGITSAAVRDFALEKGLAGARRPVALVNAGRLLGLLAPDHSLKDARVKRYKPTAATRAAFFRFLSSYADCTKLLLDSDFYGEYLGSRPDASLAVVAHSFKNYHLKTGPLLRHIEPVGAFAEKPSAFKMILSAYQDRNEDGLSPAQFGPMSRIFGVSRTQVRRIFEAAEAAGYLSIVSRGGQQIKIHAHFAELIEYSLSCYMAVSIEGALRAIEHDRNMGLTSIQL